MEFLNSKQIVIIHVEMTFYYFQLEVSQGFVNG